MKDIKFVVAAVCLQNVDSYAMLYSTSSAANPKSHFQKINVVTILTR